MTRLMSINMSEEMAMHSHHSTIASHCIQCSRTILRMKCSVTAVSGIHYYVSGNSPRVVRTNAHHAWTKFDQSIARRQMHIIAWVVFYVIFDPAQTDRDNRRLCIAETTLFLNIRAPPSSSIGSSLQSQERRGGNIILDPSPSKPRYFIQLSN